jgi:O-antigen/teichoic acid export membrane protein
MPLMILIASAISVGINTALIPEIGIIGAAISNLASYLVLAGIVTFWARKVLNYTFGPVYVTKIIIASAAMSAALYFLKVDSALGIILSIIGGSAIYTAFLFLLKAFTNQDKRLIKQTLGSLIPARKK